MKKKVIVGGLIILAGMVLWWFFLNNRIINPLSDKKREILKYEKYDFDSLRNRKASFGKIVIGGKLKGVELRRKNINYEVKGFKSEKIIFESDGKKVSGMINIPQGGISNKLPAIVMVRGYADKGEYYVGSGSWKMADYLAERGYVTVSLDFLGYAESDAETEDVLEARFEKAITLIDFIEAVKNIDFVDSNKIGIWAHSNGGQITLSVLEATGGKYPTILWAPMTNPFPKSLLDTADSGDDEVKKMVDDFSKNYDPRRYAIDNYYEWVNAPILILQGTNDVWCKPEWQEEVVKSLKMKDKKAELKIFKGADHNFSGKYWNQAAEVSINYFQSNF